MAPRESKKSRKKTAAYTEDSLVKALTAIRENKASVRQVCRDYGIPKSTVLDRIHGKTTDILKKRGPDPVLGTDGEEKIVNWLINISKCGFPVKKQELLDSVQKVLQDSSIPNKFKDCRPGQTWYLNFLKRNPQISSRSAEGINKARAQVSEVSIRNWFRGLETYLEEINQKDILNRPSSIFNSDESGFALCPKTGKVLGPRGYRNLYQVKQGNEKDNLTVLVTFNANGDVCPPCVVFPYVKPPQAVVKSMPPDWCLGRSESGWMRGDVFFEYVTNDFNNWLERNNIQKPVLLLVDGHKSHMSLMLSTICEQMHIILYALPPNTTHILQPADVSVFAPLKASWKNTVRRFLAKPENINTSVTKTNFCKLFAETLQDTNLATCIKNGFKRCGLYPFDPNAPDYTKCVLDTFKNLNCRKTTPGTAISRADVATTKKVLKQLKTALLNKSINYRVLMKELNLFKKTLPVETNISELSLDTESDCTNSTMQNGSCDGTMQNSSQMSSNSASLTVTDLLKQSADIQPTPHDIELGTDTVEIIQPPLNVTEDCNSVSLLDITGSYLEVGSVVSLDDILILPLNVTDNAPTPGTLDVYEKLSRIKTPDDQPSSAVSTRSIPSAVVKAITRADTEDLTSSGVVPSSADTIEKEALSSIILVAPETSTHAKTAEHLVTEDQPTPIPMEEETPSKIVSLTEIALEQEDSIVIQKQLEASSLNFSEKSPQSKIVEIPKSTSITSSNISETQKEAEPIVTDPFERHLYLPDQLVKPKKPTKNKIPAAISSAAWREHYEMRERLKNLKQEETRKRKLKRIERQQRAKILKENNSKKKPGPKVKTRQKQDIDYRPRIVRGIRKENDVAPTVASGKISCAECDDDLVSDVEENEDKNIGCDACPRWYHLKCTLFQGQLYDDVKDKPYKCNHCDY